MSKEKRRVPKLRFPGFTEDWEQRKLSDISTKVTTKNVDVHYTETLTNSAEQGIISQVDFFDKEISNKDNINGYYIVENHDFIYNPRISTLAPVGPINRNKLNRTGIMSPLYTVFRASKVDLGFLEWYFQSNHWHSYMKLNGDSGARADRIAIKDSTFFDMPIKTPVNIKEQVLIGETLEKFNQYITLHQRKLDNLKLKKKALLQKLFPKNGERYPELRFPGFTDAWEQRKADYIFKSVTDKGYPELPVLSASQELGMVYRDQNGIDIQHDKKNETSYKRVLPGQFVIHLRSFQGGFAYSEIEGITSPAYTVMSFKNSSEQYGLFWKHVFKSEIFIKRLETITYGIRDGRSISFSDFKSLLLQYPSFSEQKLIGDSIAVIERGITLHQRKLDHLQLQKKALLQQMFV